MSDHFIDVHHMARVLGGEASGNNVTAPGPKNIDRRNDRSMSITVDPSAPDGFIVKSHSAKNTDIECKDYVRRQLGLPAWEPKKQNGSDPHPKPKPSVVCHYVYKDQHGEPYLRVTRLSDKTFRQYHWDDDSWSPKKPAGPAIPYRLPEILANPGATIWLVEGEKDADRLASLGLIATTAPGGAGAFKPEIAQWLDGQRVVAIPDNDEPGRKWAQSVRDLLPDVKIVNLGLDRRGADVSDWLDADGTIEHLIELADQPDTEPQISGSVTPTQFQWIDPKDIPQREILYGTHLYRKFVSMTVSPGGLGKSSMVMVEALAMSSGKPLLGEPIYDGPLRVWYWNGEDPQDENTRRVVAAAVHHNVAPSEFSDRLWIDSGRSLAIKLARMTRGEIELSEDLFLAIESAITERRIDVLQLDPFVSLHSVPENDNGAIDDVVKRLGLIADRCNCAIELVHHVRKPGGGATAKTDANDARGAGALAAGVRSVRVLNVMNEDEANKIGIPVEERFSYFNVDLGKANLAKRDGKHVWRKLASVSLGNDTPIRPGDNVGVVEKYEPPASAQLDLWPANAAEIAQRVAEENETLRHWTGSGQIPSDWFGFVIARRCGLDEYEHRKDIRQMIAKWIKADILTLRDGADGNRNKVVYVASTRSMDDAPFTQTDDDCPF